MEFRVQVLVQSGGLGFRLYTSAKKQGPPAFICSYRGHFYFVSFVGLPVASCQIPLPIFLREYATISSLVFNHLASPKALNICGLGL